MILVRPSALATLLPEKKAVVFIELEAGWALELVWMFWRKYSCPASDKI